MGRIRRGRSERDTIRYLTEGRIDDLAKQLNARDMKILEYLSKFRYMNTEQLYKLIPSVGNYEAFNNLATGYTRLNKRLRFLFDNFFINKESPQLPYGQGTAPQWCWLDKGGEYIMSGDIHKPYSKYLPQNYLHYSSIVDTFIYFNRLNKILPNKPIRYFRNETKLDTINLIPDCMIVGNFGEVKPYIIEVDRGYKKEKLEINKIETYATWKASYLWKQEEWAKLVKSCPFPKIIYLVDDTRKYWGSRVARLKKGVPATLDVEFIELSKIYTDEVIFK